MFRIEKYEDSRRYFLFSIFPKKIRIMKKNTVPFFFLQKVQEVQKMFVIMKKTIAKFSSESEQKTIRHNFFLF